MALQVMDINGNVCLLNEKLASDICLLKSCRFSWYTSKRLHGLSLWHAAGLADASCSRILSQESLSFGRAVAVAKR